MPHYSKFERNFDISIINREIQITTEKQSELDGRSLGVIDIFFDCFTFANTGIVDCNNNQAYLAMKVTSPITLTFTIVLSLVASNAHAQDFHWNGGGSNTKYENADNWRSGAVPYSTGKNTMQVMFNEGGTITFDAATGTQVIDDLDMNNGSVLNMTGGVFDHGKSGSLVRTSVGYDGTGSTVNQSGGKMSIGHMLRIGEKKATGTYNLSGGILWVFRGGRSLMDGPRFPSISVGSGGATADLNISGGMLETRAGIEIDTNASFNVLGTNASSIKIGSIRDTDPGAWYQKGTLGIGIGSSGVTPIQIASGTKDSVDVQFLKGSKLDLSFHGVKPFNGSWTIMEVEGDEIVDHGLALSVASQADPSWSFEIDNSGPNGRLIATYNHYVAIPESSSYSTIVGAIGLLSLGLRRRRLC